jgi:hypothetical protein
MARTKPKVGDSAIIDGASLTIDEVEPDGKPIVKMRCAAAMGLAGRVAEARAEVAAREKAVRAANPNASEKAIGALMDEHVFAHRDALAAIPRGTTVGVNVNDLEWLESDKAWTVPGRLLSHEDRKRWRSASGVRSGPARDKHLEARAYLRFLDDGGA